MDVRRRLAAVARRWDLDVGAELPGATQAVVVEATTGEGLDAVLKLQFPHRESEHEAAALARWDGAGAVRLLRHDAARHALLLERCRPGTTLGDGAAPAVAVDVLAGLARRLAVPAGPPFTSLADEAAHLAASLRRTRAPLPAALVDAAVELLAELPADAAPAVLVSQDLHARNVLAAEREPWLAIDPKPLAGELAFAGVPIVRSSELGHGRRDAWYRLDRVADVLGVDRERLRAWTIAHTVAWGHDGDEVLARHVDTATWLVGSRPPRTGRT